MKTATSPSYYCTHKSVDNYGRAVSSDQQTFITASDALGAWETTEKLSSTQSASSEAQGSKSKL
jgi:hypothetical protein